jgi:DNA-binding NarL/FixJ family response regulator
MVPGMTSQVEPDATAPSIRVIGADLPTFDLLTEWLTSAGYAVTNANGTDGAAGPPPILAIVDIPFTRRGAPEVVQRIAAQYPGLRILALSSTFFSNVTCYGECARALGVAGVLPKPIARDALIAAIRELLQRQA